MHHMSFVYYTHQSKVMTSKLHTKNKRAQGDKPLDDAPHGKTTVSTCQSIYYQFVFTKGQPHCNIIKAFIRCRGKHTADM